MGKKASKVEKLERVQKVQEMIITGCSRESICQYGRDVWQLKKRSMDWYISEARKGINISDITPTLEGYLAEQVALRRELRLKFHELGKYGMELRTAKDEAQLLGLYKLGEILALEVDATHIFDDRLTKLIEGEPVEITVMIKENKIYIS
jgi:hypothetical protein